jgi:hypothetical protein
VQLADENPQSGDYDLLLSHRGEDLEPAEALAERLEAEKHFDGRNFRIWLDAFDLKPGHSVTGSINHGLEHSRHVGILMTPAYFQSESGWTDAEWCAALLDDPAGRSGRVIPILIRDCPYIPVLLRQLNMIDLRGPGEAREYDRLVRAIRGEPQRDRQTRGQIVRPDGRLSHQTLEAERASAAGVFDRLDEKLLCNLLPIPYLPSAVWIAPIRKGLAGGDGLSPTYPSVRELRDLISQHRDEAGLKPYSPAFRREGSELISFHQLGSPDNPLAPVIDQQRARSMNVAAWIGDNPDRRRIITSLLHMSLHKHLSRLGLVCDFDKRRYFFPPESGGAERKVKWRKRGKPRTVSRRLVDGEGALRGWRHTAANLRVVHLGGNWFIQIRPTVVFTRDGTIHSVLKGATVGPLATAWLARERNLHMAYHSHFWAHVLGRGETPVRVRAGDQTVMIDPQPLEISLSRGIFGDQVDLVAELEVAEDPDEDLDFEEEPLEDAREEQHGDSA